MLFLRSVSLPSLAEIPLPDAKSDFQPRQTKGPDSAPRSLQPAAPLMDSVGWHLHACRNAKGEVLASLLCTGIAEGGRTCQQTSTRQCRAATPRVSEPLPLQVVSLQKNDTCLDAVLCSLL